MDHETRTKGIPINEEMGFNSKEGMEIFVDVSLSYAIEPSKAPDFYVKYRVGDLECLRTEFCETSCAIR